LDTLTHNARQGVINLVTNCTEVQLGEWVVIANEVDRVEPALAALIAEVVEEQGGRPETLWIAVADGALSPAPEQVQTMLAADKVLASTRDLTFFRRLLNDGRHSLLVGNLFQDRAGLASEHARYPWGLARAMYAHVEQRFGVGARWQLTSPSGTDLTGLVGDHSVRASYLEDERPDRSRSFHSGAYTPIASTEAEGQLVSQFTGGPARIPCEDPPVLAIEGNRIASIEGGRDDPRWVEQYRRDLDAKTQRFGERASVVDSFHGGAHPSAEFVRSILGNGCPLYMHFHLGRTTGKPGDYLAAELSEYTLEVDGKVLFDRGQLAILDDPEIQATVHRLAPSASR